MPDPNIVKDLEQLKKAINEEKIQLGVCETNIDKLRKQLKEQFDVDTMEEATKRLDDLFEESEKLEKQIEKTYLKLKESYDW